MIEEKINSFFILGNPRSGTTLLRLMLDSHPYIVVPPECAFIIWFYEKYKSWSLLNYSSDKIHEFISDLKTARKIDNWHLDYDLLINYIESICPSSYAELINAIYTFFSISNEKKIKIWGDKNNYYIYFIKEIVEIFPDTKFIHIIRDGRDVACSYLELNKKKVSSDYAPKLSNNIVKIAKEWKRNNEQILDDFENILSKDKYITVKFENLIENTEDTLGRICNLLSVPFDERMLKYYRISKTYEPDEFLQWKAKTKQPPQFDRIGRFRNDLTSVQIETFNSEAGDFLKKLKYEL